MKRILLITPYTPDNQGRGVSPTSRFLYEITKTCVVDLVYFRYKEDRRYIPINSNVKVIKDVLVDNMYKVRGLLQKPWIFPIFTPRYSKKIASFLREQVQKEIYDFIYFDFSQTFSYAADIKHSNKIFMSHDVMCQRYSRERTYCLPWVKSSEKSILIHADKIFTFSSKDCRLLENVYGIESTPTNFFLSDIVLKATPSKVEDYFVFFGGWGRPDNSEALTWFLDNVAEKVKGKFRYKIIGGGMSEALKERVYSNSDFEYLGFVENPYPIIANAKAEIAPLHFGAGVKVKCVEALACGTSIIGTEIAFEGITPIIDKTMLLANTAGDYINYMSTIKESVIDKQKHKELFLKSYENKEILNYINQ